MLYVYKCDSCETERNVIHPMGESPNVMCLDCLEAMRIKIVPTSVIITSTVGDRSILGRDRPSNQEYQAYKKWEDAGGQPGTSEHKAYLEKRGYE